MSEPIDRDTMLRDMAKLADDFFFADAYELAVKIINADTAQVAELRAAIETLRREAAIAVAGWDGNRRHAGKVLAAIAGLMPRYEPAIDAALSLREVGDGT